MKQELKQDYIKTILDYDDLTGLFTWKSLPIEHFPNNATFLRWNKRYAGKSAGSVATGGYRAISVNDMKYKTHRLAFLYFHGYMPKYIDHIDHDPSNNRISNLRGVTHRTNLLNQQKRKNNTSGVTGVYWRNDIGKWAAQIVVKGCCIPLGTFVEVVDAKKAREAAEKLHGYHKNHGK